MRIIKCDRCGKVIPQGNRTGYIAVNWRAASDNSLMLDNPYEDCDLCEDCMKDIVKVIDFKIVAAPEEEETDPEEEEVVERIQKVPAKKAVDKGKVGALAQAGWNTKKIADEMGVSQERIRQILKELGTKENG